MRHLQLKTRWRDGKADAVQVNVGLAEKPGGCVVYIMVDRVTLELGPFLVLAAASGTSPLDLGTKLGRHSRGKKSERAAIREVANTRFRRLAAIEDVAAMLFALSNTPRLQSRRRSVHRQLLLAHLARRPAYRCPAGSSGVERPARGGLPARPIGSNGTARQSSPTSLTDMIFCRQAGLGDLQAFRARKNEEAQASGDWQGTALELWLCLFAEHRAAHFGVGPEFENQPLLDSLCMALRLQLVTESIPDRVARG
jgi:hypothetical protein